MGGNMRLRNKQTGEVIILIDHIFDNYKSLAELNKEWEDYKPAEPLIKDEKIRKAVRAWADAVNIQSCYYRNGCFYTAFYDMSVDEDKLGIDVRNGDYTIAELCGEEEE